MMLDTASEALFFSSKHCSTAFCSVNIAFICDTIPGFVKACVSLVNETAGCGNGVVEAADEVVAVVGEVAVVTSVVLYQLSLVEGRDGAVSAVAVCSFVAGLGAPAHPPLETQHMYL